MHAHRPILLGLGLVTLLGACASGPEPSRRTYQPEHTITLARALEVPPGQATVRLQYGHPVARNAVQDSEPHCILELDTVSDASQAVRPETFAVTSVRRREETFAGVPVYPWHTLGRGIGRDDGPSQIYFITEFRLHSREQPGVRSLSCLSNQAVAGVMFPRHLTVDEMRQAVGGYFRFDRMR